MHGYSSISLRLEVNLFYSDSIARGEKILKTYFIFILVTMNVYGRNKYNLRLKKDLLLVAVLHCVLQLLQRVLP